MLSYPFSVRHLHSNILLPQKYYKTQMHCLSCHGLIVIFFFFFLPLSLTINVDYRTAICKQSLLFCWRWFKSANIFSGEVLLSSPNLKYMFLFNSFACVYVRTLHLQGIPGAYSETAALEAYPNCETVPCEHFETAFQVISKIFITSQKWCFTMFWYDWFFRLLSFGWWIKQYYRLRTQ